MNTMIITFYSYKGGVGRTQLSANLAAYFCHYKHKKVLMIDWDLEAPGLHFYFDMQKIEFKKGLIDIFTEYVDAVRDKTQIGEGDLPVFSADYITNICQPLNNEGRIDLIPAGKYDDQYTQQINNFNWHEFYEKLDGKFYIEFLKDALKKAHYDYVFIDSRTGISDYSGICNIQIPDANVIVVSPTNQSLTGSLRIADTIANSPYIQNGLRKSIILPILSRIDLSIEHKSEEWIDLFTNSFSTHLSELSKYIKASQTDYMQKTMLDYKRDISFEEQTLFNSTIKELKDKSLAGQYRNIATYLETISANLQHKEGERTLIKLHIKAIEREGLIDEITKQIVNNQFANIHSIYSENNNGFKIVCQMYISNRQTGEAIIANLKVIEGVTLVENQVE